MLNTRQTRTASALRAMKPATMSAPTLATFRNRVYAAIGRAGVHPKYRAQFETACGLPAEAVTA